MDFLGNPAKISTPAAEALFGPEIGAAIIDWAVPLAILFAFPIMLLIGWVMERGLIKCFYKRPHADQILVTFGLAIILQEIIRYFFGANPIPTPAPSAFTGSFDFGALMGFNPGVIIYPYCRMVHFVFSLSVIGAVFAFLRFPTFGMVVGGVSTEGRIPVTNLFGADMRSDFEWIVGGWSFHFNVGYYFAAILLLLSFYLSVRLFRSPFGLMLRAIKTNQTRMRYTGVATRPCTLAAFVISGMYAGLAGGGALLACMDPLAGAERMPWTASGEVVIMTILGGAGTLLGPILGAGVIKLLRLDEPYEGLAPVIVQEIARTLNASRDEGITTIIVEQNAIAALKLADRAVILDTGTVVFDGSAAKVLGNEKLRAEYLAI